MWYVLPNGRRARCPSCGSDAVFDNRDRKRNPKAPDLRCGACEKVGWLQDGGGWRWADPLSAGRRTTRPLTR
jgi:uncharacterized protein with PIN domain